MRTIRVLSTIPRNLDLGSSSEGTISIPPVRSRLISCDWRPFRFGYVDPTDGRRVKLGTFSSYYHKSFANGDTLKVDGFMGRSLFDLYSNFTFFLNDPVHGDAFQQHDSRLHQGTNAQYTHVHKLDGISASFLAGLNFHDNEINVG